jgi:hypothetical protein
MSTSPPSDQNNRNTISLFNNRTGSRSEVVDARKSRTFRYTLWLGIIAGLTFSAALWGYETILYIQAHVAYAWLPMLFGTILCALICLMAALLTWLVNKALLGIIFWVLAARGLAELAIYLPLKITPALMTFFEPGLRSRLPFHPINSTFQTWAGIGTVWLSIFLAILGLLQLTLVESSVPATTSGGRLGAYFIFVPVMILASVLSSNMINEQLRAPLVGTNTVIQFALDHQNEKVDPTVARNMHMGAVNNISGLLNRPRRIFLGQYDEFYSQVDILVDFQGEWVGCTTISAQPVNCNPISNP